MNKQRNLNLHKYKKNSIKEYTDYQLVLIAIEKIKRINYSEMKNKKINLVVNKN
jgi:hypothetical protein